MGNRPGHTAGPAEVAAELRGPVLARSAEDPARVAIPNPREPLTRETPRAVEEPGERRGDLRRTVGTRKTAAEVVRLVVIPGRSDNREGQVSLGPVAVVEVVRPPVATAGPVERGSLTPRAVAELGGLPEPVQREQVEILDVVTAAEAGMEPVG